MCGIVGILSENSSKISTLQKYVNDMVTKIQHRGPDNRDVFFDNNISFGHARLSILDISKSGNQPMQSFSGRYVIVFNGEIYNHLEIRKKLESNFNFNKWKSNSDTETLINLFEFYDIETILQMLNGMFAFAVWDKKNQKLYLARDRFGEKPIYYSFISEKFIFFSELKCLNAVKDFRRELNKDSIKIFTKINYIPAPFTVYKDVFKLEPGTLLEINQNFKYNFTIKKNVDFTTKKFKKKRWFLNNQDNKLLKYSFNEKINILEKNLNKAVKSQLISDVNIGCFLSGGIDSSIISYFMQKNSLKQIETFTIKTENLNYDESEKSKAISKFLNTSHFEYQITEHDVKNFLPKMHSIYDEPFSDSSQIPTYILSKFASKQIKVALTGDAGDELFGGYTRHIWIRKINKLIKILPSSIRKVIGGLLLNIEDKNSSIIEKLINFILKGDKQIVQLDKKLGKIGNILKTEELSNIYFNLISTWPSDDRKISLSQLDDYFHTNNLSQSETENILVLDKENYLHDDVLTKVDRAAMANSLETRVPFLDVNMIEISNSFSVKEKISNGVGKLPLRELAKRIYDKSIVDQPKMGFGIPLNNWMRSNLREWINDEIESQSAKENEFINHQYLKNIWHEHLYNNKNFSEYIWNNLILISWLKNNK